MVCANAREIRELHHNLESAILRATGMRTRIHTLGIDAWERASQGTEICFQATALAWVDFAERLRGGRCPVFPLREADPEQWAFWVAWQEEWVVGRGRSYTLSSAGWTVFLGFPYRPKTQVLRAEWRDPTESTGSGPQPHWHLDSRLAMGMDPGRTTSLSRAHLGMAGWRQDAACPVRWQAPLPNPGALADWAKECLAHIEQELRPIDLSVPAP